MRSQSLRSVLALPSVFLLAMGCFSIDFERDAVRGSGVVAADDRALAEFHRIEVGGNYQVVVTVGGAARAVVRGDDNLVPLLLTEVRDGTLHIHSDHSLRPESGDMWVEVTAPTLDALHVAGASEASATGVRSPAFDARVTGSGELTVAGDFGDLSAAVSGSGELTMRGTAENVSASVSGSGGLDLLAVPAARVAVAVSGSGDAGVHASERLDARVSGSGDVRYRGSPAVEADVSGSGAVRRAS